MVLRPIKPATSAAPRGDELAAARAALATMQVTHQALVAAHQATLDNYAMLQQAFEAVRIELALLKRRLFVASAERIDTAQLQLEFAAKLAELESLSARLHPSSSPVPPPAAPPDPNNQPRKRRPAPTGRRDLRLIDLPTERIEILDDAYEGSQPRCGFEEREELMWRRAGFVRLTVARAKYHVHGGVDTAPLPPTLLPRSLAGPTVWAALICAKLLDGLPYHRQENMLARVNTPLDRGTMTRWQEELGALVGSTIVEAARRHFLANAFAIATDATGVLVQPVANHDQTRQPCRRGHYFVQIADADHVFFEYTPHETSAVVSELFAGFRGHVIADAKSVYDILYRAQAPQLNIDDNNGKDDEPADATACIEVGCWSHARRHMWEAAVITKDVHAREGLARMGQLFELERTWKKLSARERGQLRQAQAAPLVEDLLQWSAQHWAAVAGQRGLVRTAFGYLRNQAEALKRFVSDGRLPMTNNISERELRRIAVGRKAWLFVGSDDHAQAAGNLLSLLASAKLLQLEPEQYLIDIFRVLPQWPRDRYLELAPKFWLATKARLDPAELARPVGWITIPAEPLRIPSS